MQGGGGWNPPPHYPPPPGQQPAGGFGAPGPGYPQPFGPQYAGPVGTYGIVCPQCRNPNVSKPTFTFWGGIVGPRLLNHHVCNGCGFGFNGKTGRSNKNAIVIYLLVAVVFVLMIFGMLGALALFAG